jgi:hypothetical protein
VIVRFVDIGGVVDHDCLNFLLIMTSDLLSMYKFAEKNIQKIGYIR